jgi:hypothetical protein
MKMNALYDGVVDPNLSARNVRFGSYGLEFWHVALLLRIPLVLFRSKSIVVDRGRADNALEIQESELCIANPVRSANVRSRNRHSIARLPHQLRARFHQVGQ